jgi:hypothetical protein
MPNAVKYKTGNLTGSLQKGNVALGISGSLGPTSTTGWYNGPNPVAGKYQIFETAISGDPEVYSPQDDAELIKFARWKGATGANTGSAAAVLAWIGTQTNLMAANFEYESIVTNGLVLNLDAGFVGSYPTINTTWYDLSGNTNNGTLINGPTFNSANSGSIVFDGVDDYISVPDNAVLNFTGSVNLTSEVWIKFNQYKDISFVNAKGDGGGGANNYNYFFIGTNTSFYFRFSDGTTTQNSPFITQTNLPTGFWGHVVGVLDTTAIRLYLNGVEIGTATTRTINPKANNSSFLISSPSFALNGSVATSRIYNRALTAAEVLQNYNAQKGRFGL